MPFFPVPFPNAEVADIAQANMIIRPSTVLKKTNSSVWIFVVVFTRQVENIGR